MTERLSTADEARLSWFFSAGESTFFRSTTGPILDRQEQFAYLSEVGSTGELVRVQRDPPKCETCGGRGVIYSEERAADAGVETGSCADCSGTGLTPLTAQPGAEQYVEGGYVPNDGALHRYADIYSILERVGREDPQLIRVAETLYGDIGVRWSSEAQGPPPKNPNDPDQWEEWVARKPWGPGRLASLYQFTPTGRRYIERERDRTPYSLSLSPDEIIRELVQLKERQPTQDRIRMLRRMGDEVDVLVVQFVRAWHRAKAAVRLGPRVWFEEPGATTNGHVVGRLYISERGDGTYRARRLAMTELYLIDRRQFRREERIAELLERHRQNALGEAVLESTTGG